MFFCFKCQFSFNDVKESIKHLRKIHSFKDNVNELKCLRGCHRSFRTFNGLKWHSEKCEFIHILNESASEKHLDDNNDTPNYNIDETKIVHDNNDEQFDVVSFEDADEVHSDNEHNTSTIFFANDIHENNKFEEQFNEESHVILLDNEDPRQSLNNSVNSFIGHLNSLRLPYSDINQIYEHVESIIKEIVNSNERLANAFKNPIDVLQMTASFVSSKLNENNTQFKRQKKCKNDPKYVEPQTKAIGTRRDMRNIDDRKVPTIVQSTFEYVSIRKSLKARFESAKFREIYFKYNQGGKHKCDTGVYKNFCCGRVYNRNKLFEDFPSSLQLQIYTDDFEPLPLKSKSNVHKTTAVYFSIANLPEELLHRQENIFLIALVNSNDLKSSQTNFNHIWELIVEEIKELETIGIKLDETRNLKGTLLN